MKTHWDSSETGMRKTLNKNNFMQKHLSTIIKTTKLHQKLYRQHPLHLHVECHMTRRQSPCFKLNAKKGQTGPQFQANGGGGGSGN